jgi:23S rRNA (pseudouridine1915-N3)-methyltransferase
MLNLSRIRIITIGKQRPGWWQEGAAMYAKRLPGLEIVELKDSNPNKEAEAIIGSLKNNEKLILLSEDGSQYNSREFTQKLNNLTIDRIAIAIGGAGGHSQKLKAQANLIISFSSLTFPHDLARLILLEQIYRATTILQGSPYHRE